MIKIKRVSVFALLFSNLLALNALDFVFKIEPTVLFPSIVQPNMNISPGVTVQADFDLFNILTAGVEGGYMYEQPKSTEEGINTIFGGLNLGIYYYPVSRLYVGAGGGFGVHNIMTQVQKPDVEEVSSKKTLNGLYYRGFGEVGFRVNPSICINLAGG